MGSIRNSCASQYKQGRLIENFCNQAKRCVHKFNGIPKMHFELFFKKAE